jgi:acetyl esterase/lipase
MTTPLDPVIAQIIPLLPLRDPETMTPQSARDALRALAAARAAIPPPQVSSVSDIKVKGATGPLAARVYRVSQHKSPTTVFFHGGGWVAGDLETHDRQARLLAIETGAVVISVDYRRPPETRFPGAFDDAFAAVRDIISDIAAYGGDKARIGVAGDSAGGNLATVTALRARDEGGPVIALQVLVYPVVDNDASAASFEQYADAGLILNRAEMEWFWETYLPNPADRSHPDVAPQKAGDHSGLPPAYVVVAEFDPLRDQVLAYAATLEAAGVPVTVRRFDDQIHAFFGMVNIMESADTAVAEVGAAIRSAALA